MDSLHCLFSQVPRRLLVFRETGQIIAFPYYLYGQ